MTRPAYRDCAQASSEHGPADTDPVQRFHTLHIRAEYGPLEVASGMTRCVRSWARTYPAYTGVTHSDSRMGVYNGTIL